MGELLYLRIVRKEKKQRKLLKKCWSGSYLL